MLLSMFSIHICITSSSNHKVEIFNISEVTCSINSQFLFSILLYYFPNIITYLTVKNEGVVLFNRVYTIGTRMLHIQISVLITIKKF